RAELAGEGLLGELAGQRGLAALQLRPGLAEELRALAGRAATAGRVLHLHADRLEAAAALPRLGQPGVDARGVQGEGDGELTGLGQALLGVLRPVRRQVVACLLDESVHALGGERADLQDGLFGPVLVGGEPGALVLRLQGLLPRLDELALAL